VGINFHVRAVFCLYCWIPEYLWPSYNHGYNWKGKVPCSHSLMRRMDILEHTFRKNTMNNYYNLHRLQFLFLFIVWKFWMKIGNVVWLKTYIWIGGNRHMAFHIIWSNCRCLLEGSFVTWLRFNLVPRTVKQCDSHLVTEPLKLIPYYCLNHSSWPLSNNIEVTCRLCRVKPRKSLTSQDRQLYIKTHTKASPEINKSQIIT
jgi:hypothetical protein